MQLNAEEGGDPFYKPPAQPSTAEISKPDQAAQKPASSQENDVEAAATATIEQEA